MKRARRARIEDRQELTITSMVDVFTLLLTFLLNFVNPSDAGADELLLPDSSATAKVGQGVMLLVTRTDVRVGEQRIGAVAGEGATARLADDSVIAGVAEALRAARAAAGSEASERMGGDDAGPLLLVQCDRSIPYSLVSQLLGAAHEAGFARFRLVVEGKAG